MGDITMSRETLKEIMREVLSELQSGEQTMFTPNEVAEMATGEGFRKTGNTVRTWCSLNQVPYHQAAKGEAILIDAETVKKLRANRWRALERPDYSAMPASRKARSTRSPNHSAA